MSYVLILDLYFSKLPPQAVANDVISSLYKRQIQMDHGFLFFQLDKIACQQWSRILCAEAGVGGNKTNPLHATGASTLFQAGVPEKIIQQRSGHLSLHGLRHYKHVTAEQQLTVCHVLSSSENTTFISEREKGPETP